MNATALIFTAFQAAAASPVQFWDLTPFIQIIIGAGVAGLGCVAFTIGWIVPRPTYQKATDDAASWKALYEHERESHERTREALMVATQRVEAGVEAAQITKVLVEALRERAGAPKV